MKREAMEQAQALVSKSLAAGWLINATGEDYAEEVATALEQIAKFLTDYANA